MPMASLERQTNVELTPERSDPAVLRNAALVTSVFALVLSSLVYFKSNGSPWFAERSGDQISSDEAHIRQEAFSAESIVELSLVRDAEVPKAVAQMGLKPEQASALRSRLSLAPTNAGAAASAAAEQRPLPGLVTAAEPSVDQLSLAWITLWDTDAEDGDVVRIDSSGYSRTVTLSKQPVTIAVPVPHNSIIRVTGIRDGEGGGITVGFASGAARAAFPIMSVGQTLGLRTQFN